MQVQLCTQEEAEAAAKRFTEEYALLGKDVRREAQRLMVDSYAVIGKAFSPSPMDVDSCLDSLCQGVDRQVTQEDINRVAIKYLAKRD